jgi:hypothetical protein
MSEIHVQQIQANLKREFMGLLGLSDVISASEHQRDQTFNTRALAALVAAALLMQAPCAHAQHSSAPAGPSEKEKAKARDKQIYEKETDEAYRSTLKRLPDVKQNVDPWGNVRTAPTK